jgi:hypothetical protein
VIWVLEQFIVQATLAVEFTAPVTALLVVAPPDAVVAELVVAELGTRQLDMQVADVELQPIMQVVVTEAVAVVVTVGGGGTFT